VADLIETLNQAEESLLCSLVHKFGGKDDDEQARTPAKAPRPSSNRCSKLPPRASKAKGDLYVFVDECHRTQAVTCTRP
jgi:type I restriction enzyme R subunit